MHPRKPYEIQQSNNMYSPANKTVNMTLPHSGRSMLQNLLGREVPSWAWEFEFSGEPGLHCPSAASLRASSHEMASEMVKMAMKVRHLRSLDPAHAPFWGYSIFPQFLQVQDTPPPLLYQLYLSLGFFHQWDWNSFKLISISFFTPPSHPS